MNYSNILVPVDFSEFNKLAIRKAKEVQGTGGAQLVLTHVIDYAPPAYVRPLLPDLLASDDTIAERAQEQLDAVLKEEGLTDYRCVVRIGSTRECLLKIIKENNIDLVVMAKHSQSGLDRLAGSNTNYVVQQAKCDVLVVHE